MELSNLEFKLLNIFWLTENQKTDLCAHGKVFVKIGDEIICDENTFDITVSSTALYLLRSLKENYKKDDYASQILPCCGFNFYAEDINSDFVNIIGCPSGIDFSITHLENGKIELKTENNSSTTIDFESYKFIVLEFVNEVENFYKNSLEKTLPDDEIDRNGYIAFWNEWKTLKTDY